MIYDTAHANYFVWTTNKNQKSKTKRECEFVIHLLKKNYLPKQYFFINFILWYQDYRGLNF